MLIRPRSGAARGLSFAWGRFTAGVQFPNWEGKTFSAVSNAGPTGDEPVSVIFAIFCVKSEFLECAVQTKTSFDNWSSAKDQLVCGS